MQSRRTIPRFNLRATMAFITATAALVPSVAMATSGGPRELDVIGYDAEDGKVYFLEHFHDESGDVPRLAFMHVAGPHAGRTIRVESWYSGTLEEIERRFPERLQRLSRRLVSLTTEPVDSFSLATRITQRRAQRIYPEDSPVRKYTLQLTVSPHDGVGLATTLYAPARTMVTAYLRPKASLQEVVKVPGRDAMVAIVTYLGIPYETGYDRDVAMLLRP